MSKKVEKGKKINETNFLYNIIYNQDQVGHDKEIPKSTQTYHEFKKILNINPS